MFCYTVDDSEEDSDIVEICSVSFMSPKKCLELSGDSDKESSTASIVPKKKKKPDRSRLKLRRKTRKLIFFPFIN